MTTEILSPQQNVSSKIINIALWIVQLGTAAMFIMAGGSKLAGAEQMVAEFNAVGFGQWFRYFTGLMELSGAILLLIPALSGLGGFILSTIMIGALATHFFIIGGDPTMAFVMLAASLAIVVGRGARTVAFLKQFKFAGTTSGPGRQQDQ